MWTFYIEKGGELLWPGVIASKFLIAFTGQMGFDPRGGIFYHISPHFWTAMFLTILLVCEAQEGQK